MNIESLQETIRQENVSGWVFSNFRHRDTLADRLLGISPAAINTRQWFYIVPRSGDPIKIVHAIEVSLLDDLPGTRAIYASRQELAELLHAVPNGTYAAHVSDTLPIVSFLDAGTAALLGNAGFELVSAAALVQRFVSLLDSSALAGHERAADALYEVVDSTWKRIRNEWRAARLTEIEVQTWMAEQLRAYDLVFDHPPIVASGKHSADPHFSPRVTGEPIESNAVLQFDLWAKEVDGIYADISWVGYTGSEPGADEIELFEAVVGARDSAVEEIDRVLSSGASPTGAQIDTHTREYLISRGYQDGLRHRTGHGIDTECHGSGVNLDAVEFPDERFLLEGSLFSIEPGIYLDNFGMRTEIDVAVQNGHPVVTGRTPQLSLLTL